MIIRCKCGVYTNSGKNCSRCQDVDVLGLSEFEWQIDELEVRPDEIDEAVLEFIENFSSKYKKGNKE